MVQRPVIRELLRSFKLKSAEVLNAFSLTEKHEIVNEKSTIRVQIKKPEPPVDFRLLKTCTSARCLWQENMRTIVEASKHSDNTNKYTVIRIQSLGLLFFNTNIYCYLFVICLG